MENNHTASDIPGGNHPRISEEDLDLLIAYAENRLRKKDNRLFRHRLAAEPLLRESLSALIVYTRGTEYEDMLQQDFAPKREPAGFAAFWLAIVLQAYPVLENLRSRKMYLIPGFGATIAVCLLLVLFRSPDLSGLITESYQTAFVRHIKPADEDAKLPWEGGSAYGFSSPDQKEFAYRAFGAGLWTGRRDLGLQPSQAPETLPDFLSPEIKADKWTETPWAVYFHMGRWAFLIRSACLSDAEIPGEFWDSQKVILERILNDVKKTSITNDENARIVNDKLETVKSLLESSEPDAFGNRRKIVHELELLIKHLSPKQVS
jgi:hypothetical protein